MTRDNPSVSSLQSFSAWSAENSWKLIPTCLPYITCSLQLLTWCYSVLGSTCCVALSGSLLSFGTVSCIQGSAFRLSCLSVSVLCPSIKDSLSLTKQWALSSIHLSVHIQTFTTFSLWSSPVAGCRGDYCGTWRPLKRQIFLLSEPLRVVKCFCTSPRFLIFFLSFVLKLIVLYCFCSTQSRYLEICVHMSFRNKIFH